MPPLRKRAGDVLQLAETFLGRFSTRTGRRVLGISPEAAAILCAHHWPGNVRELANAIERAVALGADEWVRPEDLPEEIFQTRTCAVGAAPPYHEAVRDAKREIVRRAYIKANGNYGETALQLGIHVNNLHRLIRELDLKSSLEGSHQKSSVSHRSARLEN